MARLPRLVVPGRLHHVVQRAHGSRSAFVDEDDVAAYLAALREAAASERVAVHAYALADHEVQLLVTPPKAASLSRMMQTVGRRYVSAYNQRHGQRGTLWEGRFRCGIVEPGAVALAALLLVDGAPGRTSAERRCGAPPDGLVVDPPEFWALGNTPFEREAAYRGLLAMGVAAATAERLRRCALGGWACGSEAFRAEVEALAGRPAAPRARGRPRRAA